MGKFDEPFLMEPMRCGACNSTNLRVQDEKIICNQCDTIMADDVKPVAVVDDENAPWVCPWCGKGPDDLNANPADQRSLMEWDQWLEAHVTEDPCEPYQAEVNLGR